MPRRQCTDTGNDDGRLQEVNRRQRANPGGLFPRAPAANQGRKDSGYQAELRMGPESLASGGRGSSTNPPGTGATIPARPQPGQKARLEIPSGTVGRLLQGGQSEAKGLGLSYVLLLSRRPGTVRAVQPTAGRPLDQPGTHGACGPPVDRLRANATRLFSERLQMLCHPERSEESCPRNTKRRPSLKEVLDCAGHGVTFPDGLHYPAWLFAVAYGMKMRDLPY